MGACVATAVCLFLLCIFIAPTASTKGKDVEFERNEKFARAELFSNNNAPFTGFSASAFTACLHVFVNRSHNNAHEVTLLSYSSRDAKMENEILLELEYSKNRTRLYIHNNYDFIVFPALPRDNVWTQICFTWDSQGGIIQLYIDGEKMGVKKNQYTGNKIGGNGYLILGQDQDYFNGVFEITEGLEGKVTNFQLWDKVLTDLGNAKSCNLQGNVVSWENSVWRFYGGAIVSPTTLPCKQCGN